MFNLMVWEPRMMFYNKPELQKLKKSSFPNMNECFEFVFRSGFRKGAVKIIRFKLIIFVNHCRETCCSFKNNNIQRENCSKKKEVGSKAVAKAAIYSPSLSKILRVPKCFGSFLSNSQSNRQAPSSQRKFLKWTVAAPAVTVQSSLSNCCGKWGKHLICNPETWSGSCSSSLLSRRSRWVSVSHPETLLSWSLLSDPSSSYVKEGGWGVEGDRQDAHKMFSRFQSGLISIKGYISWQKVLCLTDGCYFHLS